jgi:DNA sulfur modification protein DndE
MKIIIVLVALILAGSSYGVPIKDYVDHAPFKMGRIEAPVFAEKYFSILDFGAVGDGTTLNTKAINTAIDACAKAGGGHVIIPAGIWLTGPIILRSNVDLHTERGALVQFTADHSAYPITQKGKRGFGVVSPITGSNLKNIGLTGEGIFDGAGETWRPLKRGKATDAQWKALLAKGGVTNSDGSIGWPTKAARDGAEYIARLYRNQKTVSESDIIPARDALRPILFTLYDCENVLIEDVTIRNSPNFAFDPSRCKNLIASHVNIFNEWWAQNGDGMDISSCEDVVLYRCTVSAGDDGICMKSAAHNIIIAECTVYHGHGGFVIGSNTDGGMSNVWATQCDFIGTDKGIRVKSALGRGGLVHHIYVDHIYMKDITEEAIGFDTYYDDASNSLKSVDKDKIPEFTDFTIKDIYCLGASAAVMITGLPDHPVHNIVIENAQITSRRGIHIECAENITFKNVKIHTPEKNPLTEKSVKNINFVH